MLCADQKRSRYFLNLLDVKTKLTMNCSYAFSHAWHRLPVFALNSDWFIRLSASCDWPDQSGYFGFALFFLNNL